jgi:outer membrane protein OmpA-like peptidoglycan-associated protein
MNFKSTAASILVLALFAAPVLAQDNNGTATDPAVDVAAPPVPEDILALINDRRPPNELSDDELAARAKAAKGASENADLTQDIREQAQAIADADQAELKARSGEKAEQPAAEPEPKTAEEPKAEQPAEQPAEAEKPAEQAQEAQPEAVPPEIGALLEDQRPLSEISSEELLARSREARKLSQDESLPEDVRKQLTSIARAARKELQTREEAKTKPAEETPAEKPAEQAEQPKAEEPAAETPKVDVLQEQPPAETPAPAVDKQEVQQLDGNSGEPEAEAKAKAFLDDATPADQLDDKKLRARLDGMRDLMELNALSAKTERALRQKLRADREVLRDRIAKAKAEEDAKAAAAAAEEEKKKQEQAAAEGQKTDAEAPEATKKANILITPETPRRRVLADRRPSDELDDSELRLRIQVYLDFERDDSYRDFDEEQRGYWRETVKRDRKRLRDRLVEERNIRRVELDDETNIRRIEIDDEDFDDADQIEDDIFAAEAEDEEIEKVIIAPPKKKVRRVASVEELADKPEVRNSLRRIEIDTIRFGFNEAFVREEEIENLDEIALVIERVLKKYPREVFLIEGHTDAVGSDAYNLKLSKARAEAVKKALTSFYIIPAKNLKTVGLGERYLKIPTAEQEAENRRVSLSRATAAIGQAEE